MSKKEKIRLLRLILLELVNRKYHLGICEVMAHMFWGNKFPNGPEYKFMKDYIDSQKPKEGELFFDEMWDDSSGYWWPISEEGKETRIKFLNYLISKNE